MLEIINNFTHFLFLFFMIGPTINVTIQNTQETIQQHRKMVPIQAFKLGV